MNNQNKLLYKVYAHGIDQLPLILLHINIFMFVITFPANCKDFSQCAYMHVNDALVSLFHAYIMFACSVEF